MSNTTPSKCATCIGCASHAVDYLRDEDWCTNFKDSKEKRIDDPSKRPDWCPLEKEGEKRGVDN